MGHSLPDLNQHDLYDEEFYQAYKEYRRKIFAIAGNHDGKYKEEKQPKGKQPEEKKQKQLILAQSSMWHFLLNFCASGAELSPDNGDGQNHPTDPNRKTMTQP